MSRGPAIAIAFGLALGSGLLAGCEAKQPPPPAPPPPADFASAPETDGAQVYMEERYEGVRVLVDVVARGATDVHGAAFRVRFDPDALAFASASASPAWSSHAMAIAKEGTPGQLAVVWAERSGTGVTADRPTVLGTLAFDVKAKKASPLAFRAERSAIVDGSGKTIVAAWRGGTITTR